MSQENPNQPSPASGPATAKSEPGWKTSEFAMSLAAIFALLFQPVIDAAVQALPEQSIAATIAVPFIAGVYTWARKRIKIARAEAETQRLLALTAAAAPKVASMAQTAEALAPILQPLAQHVGVPPERVQCGLDLLDKLEAGAIALQAVTVVPQAISQLAPQTASGWALPPVGAVATVPVASAGKTGDIDSEVYDYVNAN